jgi:hypothetical protein
MRQRVVEEKHGLNNIDTEEELEEIVAVLGNR